MEQIINRLVAAYDAGDARAFADCFAANAVAYEHPNKPAQKGREAIYDYYRRVFAEFPALKTEILYRAVIGSRVIDHERVRRNPNGEPFEVMAIYEIENDLIVRFDLVREAKTIAEIAAAEISKIIENQVEIRYAAGQDAEFLASFGRRTFHAAFAAEPGNSPADMAKYEDEAFSVNILSEELADPKAVFLIAEIQRKAIGYAKLLLDSREPEIRAENTVELVRLYAATEFIGKGIGAALMRACLDEAAKWKRETIWLGVWEHNLRAQAFYRKWNFQKVGSHIFQLGADAQIDILMERPISRH